PNAGAIREHIDKIGRPDEVTVPLETSLVTADVPLETGGEVWVPGGINALAKAALFEDNPSYSNFFASYCSSIAKELTIGTSRGIPQYAQRLRAYLASISELVTLGERQGDATTLVLSVSNDEKRRSTERILQLMGWKLLSKNGAILVEPGA